MPSLKEARPIFIKWRDRTFKVTHDEVIGFIVYEDKTWLGELFLTLGLMKRDGSLVSMDDWTPYGVAEVR